MLELYHWEPNASSARAMITLKEKGLEFQSRYVDVLAFEQHSPEFIALSETGETSVLTSDGEALTQSSFICEYLDEAFPGPSLMPDDPYGRWQARTWQKYVDDHLAAAVSDLAWMALGAPALKARNWSPDAAVRRIPNRMRRDVWTEALAGYSDERLAKSRSRVELTLTQLEADLDGHDWLAGDAFSLADIAVFSYVSYLPGVTPELVNERTSPRTMAWLKRVAARPAVKAALAMARTPDPFAAAAPGPEHIRWG